MDPTGRKESQDSFALLCPELIGEGFSDNIALAYCVGRMDYRSKVCSRVGVYVSLPWTCKVPLHTKEARM